MIVFSIILIIAVAIFTEGMFYLMSSTAYNNRKAASTALRSAADFCAALPEAKGKDLAQGLYKQADNMEEK